MTDRTRHILGTALDDIATGLSVIAIAIAVIATSPVLLPAIVVGRWVRRRE